MVIMRLYGILLSLFFVLLILIGCRSKTPKYDRLPAIFPNIESVCKYFDEHMIDNEINYSDVLDKLHYCFLQTGDAGWLGYNWFGGIVIADINNDGIFELYLNAATGSGIIHDFIHCYDPAENKYYIISKRHVMDYVAFVYKGNIYIYGNTGDDFYFQVRLPDVEKGMKLFKPSFVNDDLFLEEIEINLYNEIINEFDFTKECKFSDDPDIHYNLIKNNILKR
jgi:hypothetical protein